MIPAYQAFAMMVVFVAAVIVLDRIRTANFARLFGLATRAIRQRDTLAHLVDTGDLDGARELAGEILGGKG